jgi:phosphoribosyl 1,2-cyclic phosphodiesterase
MIKFASLGSGSKGNATVVKTGNTSVLLDCGFSLKEVEKRLSALECSPDSIRGILVTHEHIDHIGGVGRLSRKYKLPVWLTAGTCNVAKDNDFHETHLINPHEAFEIGDIHMQPFPVPHDAREPCQFIFSDGKLKLGILTDTGTYTPHIIETLQGLHGLLLECNYDADMLATGSYPYRLKARVAGNYGHLDNNQSCELLKKLDTSKLQHLIGMHVSENNNSTSRALDALCSGIGCSDERISIATQESGFFWKKIL